jgi:integrase
MALLLQIYTAARPGEVRGARWGQIDFENRLWHRPAELMKGSDAPPHTVTLSAPALTLLRQLRKSDISPERLIFPGQNGGLFSDMTMSKVIRDLGLPFDAHGFRSSFRDWAAEQMPNIPDPVAEAALAHLVPDKVIRA